MQKLTSVKLRSLVSYSPLKLVAMGILFAGLAGNVVRAQDSFETAQDLGSTEWGAVTNDNTGVLPESGTPNIAGYAPNGPVWYKWTAPQDGVVSLDTVGSLTSYTNITIVGINNGQPVYQTNVVSDASLDTVLGVYTGSSVSQLTQVAANDNLFPVNNDATRTSQSAYTGQETYSGSGAYVRGGSSVGTGGTLSGGVYTYTQPFYGPSGLKFNAQGGTTYYFAVDTKPGQSFFTSGRGPIVLNWAYKPSGVFRFASEDVDPYSKLLLYQTAETESLPIQGSSNDGNSAVDTYYQYNAPGLLVTVTRVAGSTGRAVVDYTTEDVTTNMISATNDSPAVAGLDYTPVSGRLVFDDFEMSKTILIPISSFGSFFSSDQNNHVFAVKLVDDGGATSPQLDPFEAWDVSQPRVDPTFSTALVRILNVNVDPYGPDMIDQVVTNTDGTVVTNQVESPYPANTVFNFEKSNYRVPADVNDPNTSPWTSVTLWVERYGTNTAADSSVHYRVNNEVGSYTDPFEQKNIYFPLQPASDYAVPTPPDWDPVRGGTNSDFSMAQGGISFPEEKNGQGVYEPVTFTVPTSTLTKFNKDFKVQLYHDVKVGNDTVHRLAGMVAETTVTILFNDLNPPAGSVDEFYNADFNSQLALYPSQVPLTTPPNNPNPGVGINGQVYSVQILTNNESIIGGDFASYNGFGRNCIALVTTNGQLDTSFDPGTGADGAVNAVGIFGDQFYVGGKFTSFNGTLVGRIVRLNADGSLDTSFNPGLGANDTVRALTVLTNGEVMIAGDFTDVNGVARNHIALLNTDGTVDTTFDVGAIFDGPVYSLARLASGKIMVGGNFSVAGQIYKNIARLNSDGTLDVTFDPGTGANDSVRTIAIMPRNQVVIGGDFTQVNGASLNHIARLNADGSIDTGFYVGTGANHVVYNINYASVTNGLTTTNFVSLPDGSSVTNVIPLYSHYLYVGGSFGSFNGTHRYGFARLYLDGTVDTTFMDTAYNQFAGLKRIYSYDTPAVFASAVQPDGNILIGGSFNQVGGGQVNANVCNALDDELFYPRSFDDPNLWVEPKSRDGVRNRSGFARLIGGATPGPGNISLAANSFSANKSQSSLSVSLVRTNGTLGPVSANFAVLPNQAQSGVDYSYYGQPPLYWVANQFITHPTRERSDGLFGFNGFLADPDGLYLTLADLPVNQQSAVTVSIINNQQVHGDLNAQFELSNPSLDDNFYLGGQNIPVGAALGVSSAPFKLVDDTSYPGTFGFSSTSFVATNLNPVVTVVRSNGLFGVVSMRYSSTNGTAVDGIDYAGVTNQVLVFGQNVASNGFNLTIKDHGIISTDLVEKTINLRLFNLGTTVTPNPPQFGISNAVVRLINPNFRGYVSLGATNYGGTITSGRVRFVVNRIAGSQGMASVQYATVNGSAINGVDYIGETNTLTWDSGDVSPRIVTIPLFNPNVVGPDKQFSVVLSNPTWKGASEPGLFGLLTNATLTITNDNKAGTLAFSVPSYLVNEQGGFATITVVRSGGAVGPISALYSTSDGTATNGVNYTSVNGSVTLASGQTSASFTVPILNDGVADPAPANFYFNVSLSGPGISDATQVHIIDAQTYNRPPGTSDPGFVAQGMNGDVFALATQTNGQILAAGNFTAVGPVPKSRIARLNPDGTLDSSFLDGLSGANAAVNAVAVQSDGRIMIGGAFNTIDGIHRNFIARLMSDGSLDTSLNPGAGADSSVSALAIATVDEARKIYVGGAFGAFNGFTTPGLVRLNNDGSVDGNFDTGAGLDGQVYAIAVYPTNSIYAGKVLIGGAFNHYNGVSVTNLARLNADGSLDTTFNLALGTGPDAAVHALAIQPGGKVLVGGSFTNFNATSINRIVRLNLDGTVDTNFVAAVGAGANNVVSGILVQPDGRIVLVGQFTQANGLTRNHVTRLLSTGAADPTINFGLGANGDVAAVVMQPGDNALVIGGAFTQYNGQPQAGIARIYGGGMTGSGAFTFTSGNYEVYENGLVAPITILRTGGTSGTNGDLSGSMSVKFSTVGGGSAVDGVNYLSVTTNVDFPAGEVVKTVLVPVLDDFVVTSNLTVNLALTNPTPPATNGVQTTATLTILNSDSTVAFTSAFFTQAKNTPTGVAVISAVRSGGTNTTSTVDFYTTTNGTAVIGTDYYPTNATLTFNPGQLTAKVQVPIINNNLAEGNKTVAMILTNAVDTMLTSPSNATLTIIDTVSAPGQLYFSSTNFAANEGDGNAYLTVLRTNGSSGTVSATYTLTPGTAQPGVNYTVPGSTVTFGNGEITKNIAIPLVDNNIVQGPVTLTAALSAPTGGATLTDPTNTMLTISDNDAGFAFVNATNYVRETNGIVPIFVQRIGQTNAGAQVSYFAVDGTAKAGVNYQPVSGTLTFGANEMLKSVSLPLLYDPQVTGNLNFQLKLSNPSAGTVLATPTNSVIVVQDADAGISFTNSTLSLFKNVGFARIPVISTNTAVQPVVIYSNGVPQNTPLTVQFATVDGTATAGVDYGATNGTLYFTNGIVTNIISVPIYNNSQVLGDHDFTVKLLNPTAPGKLISPSSQKVTIVDNNSGISFSSPVYQVLKTGVASTITVLRTDFTNTTTSVRFATADGTAVAGVDYVPTNGVFVFTNGQTIKTFNVTVLANTTVQPDKTVLLQLSDVTNGILTAPYAATLTIHDDTGSLVVPAGSTFAAGGDPNNNGLIDPGETVSLLFALRASGGTNIPNVYATLLTTNGVTAPTPAGPVSYGPMTVNGPSVSRPFTFTANGTNSQQIVATFRLNNGAANIGFALFTYRLGTWTTTFYNSNGIVINDQAVASPYPSTILVTNVGGVVVKSVVTLTNLYHGFTKDIEALVVSPSGRDTMLMGHAGSSSAKKITLTFDDAATNSLPASGSLVTGTNKPTAYPSTTVFP